MKLQSLEGIKLPQNDNAAFKALGNAVNSKIVGLIAEKLLIDKPKKINGNNMIINNNKILKKHEPAR